MNQNIFNYLRENKEKFSKEDLIKALRDGGYKEEEINESLTAAYEEKAVNDSISENKKEPSKSSNKTAATFFRLINGRDGSFYPEPVYIIIDIVYGLVFFSALRYLDFDLDKDSLSVANYFYIFLIILFLFYRRFIRAHVILGFLLFIPLCIVIIILFFLYLLFTQGIST